jgi:hypothetical protein
LVQERAATGVVEATTSTNAGAPRWLWGAALLALGALFGAALSHGVTTSKTGSDGQTTAPGAPQPAAQALAAVQAHQAADSAGLRHDLLTAMARPEPTSTPPSDDPHVHEPSQAELLDSVRLQPRDEVWAPAAQATLEQDLAQLAAQLKFRVGDVACRTTGCVAELEWPNGAQAQRDFKAVMSADTYRLDCHRRLLVPGAGSPSGHAQLIVNCDTQLPRTKTP